LEHLTSSHTKLRAAQAKFRDCVNSINDGMTGSAKKGTDGRDEILVPLTSSLYVKGRLTDREKVLVDVGTGFYVEKVWLENDWARIGEIGQLLIAFWVGLDCREGNCFL
jgi:prefoldin alpha subunit